MDWRSKMPVMRKRSVMTDCVMRTTDDVADVVVSCLVGHLIWLPNCESMMMYSGCCDADVNVPSSSFDQMMEKDGAQSSHGFVAAAVAAKCVL